MASFCETGKAWSRIPMQRRFMRHYFLIAVLLVATGVTLWRYVELARQGGKWITASGQRIVSVRGAIYDRNGSLLAVDTDLYDVSVWKPSVDQGRAEAHAAIMAEALGMEAAGILDRLVGDGPDFAYLVRRTSSDRARELERLVGESRITGVRVDRISGRIYPERALGAHLVGFVGLENKGLAGAEAAFDRMLMADPATAESGLAYGNSVYLTMDVDLQYRLEQLAEEAMKAQVAESVVIVAMEAKTGNVLSYVSMPDFDPNEFLQADRSTWIDRIGIYAYEPGSVFKVFTMASVMALGGIDEKSSFICNGSYKRVLSSGEEIVINCLGHHGEVDLTRILEYSCNAGAAYASDRVSSLDFYAKLREFGFGERSGADLAGESPGVLRAPSSWSARSKPTIAIGQEVLVTALQMASAATVLANGGILLRPRTLARVVDPKGQTLLQAEPVAVRRVLDERTAQATLNAMEAAVLDTGTGRRARIDDLRLSVKTGTAQMIDPATRRYSNTDFIASTLALFPSEAPEYILYVAIIKPRGDSTYGGRIAAPLIRDAANIVADLYGVARTGSAVAEHDGRISLPALDAVIIGDVMPRLIGLPKRAITALLERQDLAFDISGDGWVVHQEPGPGEPVSSGSTILLRLE
jgi:cell division protein FtsI (penicillin-binding protein 3)